MRSQAMRLRQELGLPLREITRVMVLNTTTVFGWAQRCAAQGEASLVSRKPGRAYLSSRTLTLPQEWVLRTIMTSQAPSTIGLLFALWDRWAVHGLIKIEFAIDMPIRMVGEYLKRWIHTPQCPISQALEQMPWDVQRWMQAVYPLIAQKVKNEDCIIFSAISCKGLVRFEFLESAATTEMTLGFIQRLVQNSEWHKTFLILNNLRAHPTKEVAAWVQAHTYGIEVFYLPPYAPQSRPYECLSRDFKTHLRSADRNRTRDRILDKAAVFMEFLFNSPERV